MADADRIAAALNYVSTKADPLESFRSLEGLKGAYDRRVQPIINSAKQTFMTGGLMGDVLRAYGNAAAPTNAAVLSGMGMPSKQSIAPLKEQTINSSENFVPMGDPQQQAVGQFIGDPLNFVQPVASRLANAVKFAKPDALKALKEMSQGARSPLDVYHGTPHTMPPTPKNPLGEFDPTKIGSGEGAQAYGYGHYVAEAPTTAKGYKDTLAFKSFDLIPEAEKLGLKLAAATRGEFMRQTRANKPPEILAKQLQNANISARDLPEDKLVELFRQYQERGGGNLYKIDLADKDIPKMIDWDAPLSKQTPEVINALKGIESKLPEIPDFNMRKWMDADPLASTWHNVLQRDLGVDPKDISNILRENGIKGIKYWDAGSKDLGKGNRNFVVFPGEEESLKILGRE